jgi:hypothetical protein
MLPIEGVADVFIKMAESVRQTSAMLKLLVGGSNTCTVLLAALEQFWLVVDNSVTL